MDELNRRQDNNVHILIVPRGKMACDSRAEEGRVQMENTEQKSTYTDQERK